MRFLVDHMLGKLARWLRFMGHDTLYFKRANDKQLLKVAKKENRILLTRDKELSLHGIKVRSIDPKEQLRQVVKELNLPLEKPLSRCSSCNTLLREVDKQKVKDKVPPGVYRCQVKFWYCHRCGKYYWPGTHYEKIIKELTALERKS